MDGGRIESFPQLWTKKKLKSGTA